MHSRCPAVHWARHAQHHRTYTKSTTTSRERLASAEPLAEQTRCRIHSRGAAPFTANTVRQSTRRLSANPRGLRAQRGNIDRDKFRNAPRRPRERGHPSLPRTPTNKADRHTHHRADGGGDNGHRFRRPPRTQAPPAGRRTPNEKTDYKPNHVASAQSAGTSTSQTTSETKHENADYQPTHVASVLSTGTSTNLHFT